MVSLQSARKKGNDTRVTSDVQQLRTQLESDYNGTTNYGAGFSAANTFVSTTGTNYATLTGDATSQGGAINVVTTGTYPNITAYAIYGLLPSTKDTVTLANQRYFCIDSTGKTNPSAAGYTGIACPQ